MHCGGTPDHGVIITTPHGEKPQRRKLAQIYGNKLRLSMLVTEENIVLPPFATDWGKDNCQL
jgi:hypothetical protein